MNEEKLYIETLRLNTGEYEIKTKGSIIDQSDYFTINTIEHALQELAMTIDAFKNGYSKTQKIADYLYSVVFEEIPEDQGLYTTTPGGCSSFVKDGKLYRNLDWYYSKLATFLIKCPTFKGMAFLDELLEGDNFDREMIGQLPYHLCDGVNEDGIMVAAHVLYNDWEWNGDGSIPLYKVPYIILSTVHSMDNLEEDLADILNDLCSYSTIQESEHLLHFIITDGITTYNLTPSTTDNSYELINITENPKIANFRWVNKEIITDRLELQDRPNGIERWNLMPCNLSDIRYTKAYETPEWLSEFIGENHTTKYSTDEELLRIYNFAHDLYEKRTRDGITWQTMYNVIYSPKTIENLYIQEDWTKDIIRGD